MELEILDSLQEGNGLRIEEEDLDSLPQRVRQHPHLPRRPGPLAARMRYGETMAEKDSYADRKGSQRGSTLEVITVAELLDPIPEAAREELETYLNEDLRGAVVTVTAPIVDEDGRIYFDEIALRLEKWARGRDRGRDAGQVAHARPGDS